MENLFFSFDTPQSLFKYAGHGEIVEIVDGKKSTALITKKDDNNYSTFFISKKDSKYKIIPFNASKIVSSKQRGAINIAIYKVRNTDDYFVRICGISDEEIELVIRLIQNSSFISKRNTMLKFQKNNYAIKATAPRGDRM